MSENLALPASTQYGDWRGTASGDEADFDRLGRILGIDVDHWMLILVDIEVYGGSQYITAYGIPGGDWSTYAGQASTGRIEVTRLIHRVEDLHDHMDTNPPLPPTVPVTWATDLLVFGFKRFHLRLQWRPDGLPLDAEYEMIQVASLVDEE